MRAIYEARRLNFTRIKLFNAEFQHVNLLFHM